MDIHRRVTGILHIISGLLIMGGTLIAALFFGVLFGLTQDSALSGFIGLIAGLGTIVFVAILLLGLAQVVAGIEFLRGNRLAGTFLVVFGVLSLVNFPFGTALGLYTIWVLLIRKDIVVPA